MSTTFFDRWDELRRMTRARDQRVVASVIVDQVYAHYQHERMELRHPRGGKAKYLEAPLYDNYGFYLREYASEVLRDGGLDALWRGTQHLVDQVEISAPREWGDLMRSGHPRLLAGEADIVLRDREPKVHRLTEAELRAKSRAIFRMRLAAGLTVYFMRNGRVMVIPGRNEPHALRGRL